MDNVSKQQLILTSLLVALVTAITTSVATVSLLEDSNKQAQTIYRVIEKSIEKVADIPTVKNIVGKTASSDVSTLSPTNIAEKNSKSVVRVFDVTGGERHFVALGLAVGTKDALIASPLSLPFVPNASQFVALTESGEEIPLVFNKNISFGLSVFGFDYKTTKSKVTPITLKGSSGIKLGSSVVALGGKESGDVVSVGIVTEMRSVDGTASSTKNIILSDMKLSTPISGWLLFDTEGGLIGLETGFDEGGVMPVFVNTDVIEAEIKEYL